MINVIWQTIKSDKSTLSDETNGQYEYISNVIFKNIEYIECFDNKQYKTFLDNSIIIYSAPLSGIDNGLKIYLEKYNSMGLKYILLHLSNSSFNHNYSYYTLAKHVFRFHYDPSIRLPNVTTLPLGFVTGYMNNTGTINLSDKRDTLAVFIGQPKHDRQFLMDIISDMDNSFVYSTKQWNCSTKLSFDDVIAIYKKTIFVPCPIGNVSQETLRLYEALEWGCIPVVKKYNGIDYYRYIFGEHPLLLVDDWSELPNLVMNLNNESLDALILSTNNWYRGFMESIPKKVEAVCSKILMGGV